MTEALRLSAGVRYTKEEKDYARLTRGQQPTMNIGGVMVPVLNTSYGFPRRRPASTKILRSCLPADYQLSDDAMVYARYSQGFKSGGFNGRANSATEATAYAPKPQTPSRLAPRPASSTVACA